MDTSPLFALLDPGPLSLAAGGLSVAALIALWAVWAGQRRLLNRYRRLLYGPKGVDLEAILLGQAATIDGLRNRVDAAEQALERNAAAAVRHVQHLSLVRFQAFPGEGSDLSFSLAILDGNRNGFVLTSLYGRSESRVYAKPITNGTSTYVLTDEERTALTRALEKGA